MGCVCVYLCGGVMGNIILGTSILQSKPLLIMQRSVGKPFPVYLYQMNHGNEVSLTHTHTYAHTHTHTPRTHTHTHTHTHIQHQQGPYKTSSLLVCMLCTHVCLCVCVCMCVCISACACIYVCLRTYRVRACVHACMRACVCMFVSVD